MNRRLPKRFREAETEDKMDLGLAGKKALVTAASRGLGFATAQCLVEEGADVVICSRDGDKVSQAVAELSEINGTSQIAGIVTDVSNPEDISGLVDFAIEMLGGLDILVTNAGGPPGGTFDSTSIEDWEKGVQITLMSAVRLIKTALPHLRQSDSASILTITSISVKEPIAGIFLSNAIRPGVIGLTKTLSQELGPEGIRVNSILPGFTLTERQEELIAYNMKVKNITREEELASRTASIPMGRMGTPEEFGRVAAFLASPAASYVSGTMVQVDGGRYQGLM